MMRLLVVVLFAATLASCTTQSAPVEPDRVVGVVMKCTYPAQTKSSATYNDIPDGHGGYITTVGTSRTRTRIRMLSRRVSCRLTSVRDC